ncbi:MAG: restriction endonuclease, partial [Endozoicomonadaceae bacterium]|nr:restriction endonuclease [Endozoicomonadaceae bacterium]
MPKQKVANITVFEFDLLSADKKAKNDNNKVHHIPDGAFDYLEKCCLCDDTESRFLKMKIVHGMKVLQVQNYAGVVLCPDGAQIEVLPKVAKANEAGDTNKNEELARLSLLMMLRSLKKFRHIETEVASIKKQKMPLMEIFISQFLNSVNVLVKKGIRSDYVREQNNGTYLKGK